MRPGFYTRKSVAQMAEAISGKGCFNEAGILHPEKRSSTVPRRRELPGFNEAGILHPEKLRVHVMGHIEGRRFNEAGILHPEKHGCCAA